MNVVELPEPLLFEWDEYNQTKIRLKHGIDIQEVESAFLNNFLVRFDEDHSAAEQRYQLLGVSDQSRILFIVFTVRGGKARIILARVANKKERSNYGQTV